MRTLNHLFTATAITLIATIASCDKGAYIDIPTASKLESPTNPNSLNGHEYVDLGLSVKWATCNVDAQHPEDFGEYYAWGDDAPHGHILHILDSLGVDRKAISDDYLAMFKNEFKFIAIEARLEKKRVDIANYKWGNGWHMPSAAEFKELYENCTWQEVEIGGKVCFKGTSKIPGYTDCFIILPGVGYKFVDEDPIYDTGASFWSSTSYSHSEYGHYYKNAYHFNAAGMEESRTGSFIGMSVRPVCK